MFLKIEFHLDSWLKRIETLPRRVRKAEERPAPSPPGSGPPPTGTRSPPGERPRRPRQPHRRSRSCRPGPTGPGAARHGQPARAGSRGCCLGGGGTRGNRDPAGGGRRGLSAPVEQAPGAVPGAAPHHRPPGGSADAERSPCPGRYRRSLLPGWRGPRARPSPAVSAGPVPSPGPPHAPASSREKKRKVRGPLVPFPSLRRAAPFTPVRERRLSGAGVSAGARPTGPASPVDRQRPARLGSARRGSRPPPAPSGHLPCCGAGEATEAARPRPRRPSPLPGSGGAPPAPPGAPRSPGAAAGAPRDRPGCAGGEQRRRPLPLPAGGAGAAAPQMKGCAGRRAPRRQVPSPPTPPRVHMSEFTDLAAAFTTLSCKRADIKPV